MKSAEEYVSNLETYNQVSEQPMLCLSPIALKSTIKQIQLDAFKAGAEWAAIKALNKEVLIAAQQLTEIPL